MRVGCQRQLEVRAEVGEPQVATPIPPPAASIARSSRVGAVEEEDNEEEWGGIHQGAHDGLSAVFRSPSPIGPCLGEYFSPFLSTPARGDAIQLSEREVWYTIGWSDGNSQ